MEDVMKSDRYIDEREVENDEAKGEVNDKSDQATLDNEENA
jgi:cell division protein FtsL